MICGILRVAGAAAATTVTLAALTAASMLLLAGCATTDSGPADPRAPAAPAPSAAREATQAVVIAPEQARSPAARALLTTAREQLANAALEQAGATLERALTIAPDDAAVWHGLGVLAYRRGDLDQALTLAAQARGRSRGDAAIARLAWRLSGRVHADSGETAAAEAAFSRAAGR